MNRNLEIPNSLANLTWFPPLNSYVISSFRLHWKLHLHQQIILNSLLKKGKINLFYFRNWVQRVWTRILPSCVSLCLVNLAWWQWFFLFFFFSSKFFFFPWTSRCSQSILVEICVTQSTIHLKLMFTVANVGIRNGCRNRKTTSHEDLSVKDMSFLFLPCSWWFHSLYDLWRLLVGD